MGLALAWPHVLKLERVDGAELGRCLRLNGDTSPLCETKYPTRSWDTLQYAPKVNGH
jgi:hypothetical protein